MILLKVRKLEIELIFSELSTTDLSEPKFVVNFISYLPVPGPFEGVPSPGRATARFLFQNQKPRTTNIFFCFKKKIHQNSN